MNKIIRTALPTAALSAVLLLGAVAAEASHSWGGYHWARTSNPFTIKLGNNLTGSWGSYLATASTDWTVSVVLDTTIVAGNGGRNCKATAGRVEVCNRTYGSNGWLGIAQIWITGSHITQGVVKLNDTYFNTPTYNTSAWRNLVMCQEVGHTFGLGHQDENFSNANLNTCMDYTSNPASNQHPNQHDYDQLALIYAHLDSTTTVVQTTTSSGRATGNDADSNDPKAWGKEIHRSVDGRSSVFEEDRGNGQKIIRHVFWTEPRGHHPHE